MHFIFHQGGLAAHEDIPCTPIKRWVERAVLVLLQAAIFMMTGRNTLHGSGRQKTWAEKAHSCHSLWAGCLCGHHLGVVVHVAQAQHVHQRVDVGLRERWCMK